MVSMMELDKVKLVILLRDGRKANTCFLCILDIWVALKRVIIFWICTWLVENEYLLFRILVWKYFTCKLLASFDYLLRISIYKLFGHIFKFLRITLHIILSENVMKIHFVYSDLEKNTRIILNKIFSPNIKKNKKQNT